MDKNDIRRRSRSLAAFDSKNLCERVPKSLKPSERLTMLLEQSFLYALSVAKKEFPPKNGDMSTLNQKGAECWQKIIADIEEKQLIQSAVGENGFCDSFIEIKAEECNEAVESVEAESEKWSDQVNIYRESLKKEIDSSYSIKTSEYAEKFQSYDYTDIIKQTSDLEKNLFHQINKLDKSINYIKSCVKVQELCESTARKKYERDIHRRMTNTPRTIIKKLASARRNDAE